MEEKNMDKKASSSSSEQECEVRKGPWTMEEDLILINYISTHGEGVWNNLARSAGLKRTGKSCRLRWLNYLRPDIRRGNITPEEQLLIMDLQARWGNRWSKIARQLPGRTDNEIKNYWRTRIQKKVKTPPSSTTEKYECQNPITPMEEASTSCHTTFDDTCINPCSSMYIDDGNPDGFVNGNPNSPPQSSDGFWGVDDLWSMHLFNND